MSVSDRNISLSTIIQLSVTAEFELTYQSYYHPLCFYAGKFVGDEAEDLIENLFVKLWDKKQVFNDAGHLRGFLYQATRNACLDYLKNNRRRGLTGVAISEELAISDEDHLHYMMKAETHAEIYRAIHQLPSQCSKVITLSFLEGMSNAEIAREMGLSEQTVKNHKGRGLALLKDKLSGRALSMLMLIVWVN